MPRPLKWDFVLRGGVLAVMALALVMLAGIAWGRWAFPPVPYGLPPPPPEVALPAAEPPAGPAGLQLWVRYGGEPERLAGSAFVLALPEGGEVGVTAAHNLDLGDPDHPLESMVLRIATTGDGLGGVEGELGGGEGGPGSGASMQVVGLHGEPGRPRQFGLDLSEDHVLLRLERGEVTGLALVPDLRGGAQPGERILLIGGIDGSRHAGSVFQAGADGIWCLMDDVFEPGLISGSPVVSLHTGRVVGMALAAGKREGRLVLGLHPIGPLVELAQRDDGSG